jgi:signal transduction histidine kinase
MNKQPNRYSKKIYALAGKSLYFPPLIVALVVLSITFLPWQSASQNLKSSQKKAIAAKTTAVESIIQDRFNAYENKLSSGVALMRANKRVDKQQWQDFFSTAIISKDPIDSETVGYAKVFPANESADIQAFAAQQGYQNFYIHPENTQGELSSAILFVHPLSNKNMSTIGLNMMAQSYTKEAMLRAKTTAAPALTKKAEVTESAKQGNQPVVLFVPHFANNSKNITGEERNQNLQGYVYTEFEPRQLLSQLLDSESRQQHFSVQVYSQNQTPENLLYQTDNFDEIKINGSSTAVTKDVPLFGATWKMSYQFDTQNIVSASEQNAPKIVIGIGVILAGLVYFATLSFFRKRMTELQQQKDAEVDMAKDELLSLASHQMRTPATGVKQYLGMVLQGFAGEIDPDQKVLLQKAYEGNERQLHVINQILQLAKLESGRIVLAKYKTDVKKLVQDVVEEQQSVAEEHGHTLKVVVPKKSLELAIDQHMIRMVLENLVSNALKYTLESGVVTVRLSQTKQTATITVTDTGIGIAADQKEQVFKQFTRLHTEKTALVSGTGIGLYLADQLISLHGGKLDFTSKEGQGTTFTVTLPKKSAQGDIKKE